MKIIKNKNTLIVFFDDGQSITETNCSDELYQSVINSMDNPNKVKEILSPEFFKKKEEILEKQTFLEDVEENSSLLTVEGTSIYLKNVSDLTLPEDLAKAIYKAEMEEETDKLEAYVNFWTLCSLNPDSRARHNLFWFLNRYGMTISKSGFFIAYRNVNIKNIGDLTPELISFITDKFIQVKSVWKQKPSNYYVGKKDEDLIITKNESLLDEVLGNLNDMFYELTQGDNSVTYTDGFSKTFSIKLGDIVSMPRSECDSNNDVTCSRGLHVAGKKWLTNNYFGDTSLMVLVNPQDVVAVPHQDNYGKMRTCAYYPMKIVEWDENNQIVDQEIEDGFEDDFISKTYFETEGDSTDTIKESIEIPFIPELSEKLIKQRLKYIKERISKRFV